MPEVGKLEILNYPHPLLRHKSKPLKRVDAGLRSLIREMFDRMYEARGIGLAANQVGLPYRLFVANLTADPDEKDEELVFINPVLSQPKGTAEAEEGCLSIPDVYENVIRPAEITVNAYSLDGREVTFQAEGLLSRCIQHETDHLDGVLFIDRVSDTDKPNLLPQLQAFERDFASKRTRGEVPDEGEIQKHVAELERLRT